MSLIHPLILYGLGLAAIPVILHFLMRTKPKKLLFPALRLIQVRQRKSVRRLRLRHIWLLLLRVAVICLLVLAIARPSLPAANYTPNLREWLTLLSLGLLAGGIYAGVVRSWRRQQLPRHQMRYKRTMLRGTTGSALAVAVLLLFVWPYQRRIAAEIKSPLANVTENLPVAAVFLFDTSPSMQYRWNSKTRLEVGKEIAVEHLGSLPSNSRIAVADTSTDNPILFRADYGSAQEQIAKLDARAVSLPLDVRLRDALAVQEEDRRLTNVSSTAVSEDPAGDRYLREIYLFTDMARTAWQAGVSNSLQDELSRVSWVQVYLIDVGVDEPSNVGISSLRLSKQTIPRGTDLVVTATIEAAGRKDVQQSIEIYVQNERGNLVEQGQRTFRLDADTGARVSFTIPGLTGPFHQGEMQLMSSDPLQVDDIRYFTVSVLPPPEILIVEESRDESYIFKQALSPSELELQGKNRYRCTYLPAWKLDSANLGAYDVVCLINVQSPSEAAWDKLARFVREGGGLAVIAGHRRIDPVAYDSGTAQTFLPATLEAKRTFQPAEYLDLQDFNHPLFEKFENYPGGFGPLRSEGVRRCWFVEPAPEAHVIAVYTDSRRTPALVERLHGKGRTLLLTTAVDRQDWSDLTQAGWHFVVLADQMMQYLGRRTDKVYNYEAGEQVVLELDGDQDVKRYLVRKPGFEQIPDRVPPGASAIVIDETDQAGQYEVVAAESESRFVRAFSVNVSDGESRFARIGSTALDERLGEDRYSVSDSIDGLTRNVNTARIGVEAVPLLLCVMLIAFCAEHVAANRFYDADQSVDHE